MLSRSRNVVKYNQVVLQDSETRVIDYNERIAEKIEELSRNLEESLKDDDNAEYFPDEFTDGIEAVQVSKLLDDDGEGVVAESVREPNFDGPSPQDLIEQANVEVERLLNEARQQADEIRQQAQDEGYRAGYNDGMRNADNEIASLKEQAMRELEEKDAQQTLFYQQKVEEIEPALVDKITNIYEHIFRVRLQDEKDIVFHLLANALRDLDGGHEYLVHVSSEDISFVSTRKEQLMEACGIVNAGFEIIEDTTLNKNQCLIETDNGIFDCSLGVELEELKKELILLSYEGHIN